VPSQAQLDAAINAEAAGGDEEYDGDEGDGSEMPGVAT